MLPTISYSILDKPRPKTLPISSHLTPLVENQPLTLPVDTVQVPVAICPANEIIKPSNETDSGEKQNNPIKETEINPAEIPSRTPADTTLVITKSNRAKRVRATKDVNKTKSGAINLRKLIKTIERKK